MVAAMMKTLLALPVVLAAACADSPAPGPDLSDSPQNPIAYQQLSVDGAAAPIATGGVQVISIANDPLSVGWSATASDGIDVEPFGQVWPNTRKPEYFVHVVSGGSFAIQTDHGIAAGQVATAEVARVALVRAPVAARAVSASTPGPLVVEVALYDANGHRLIDGSLAIRDANDPNATQIAWDRIELQPAAAGHTIVVNGDSISEQRLSL
jgi:hypothetical protein